MTTQEVMIADCECDECGRLYHYELDGAEYSDQCPQCQAKEEARAKAEEEREEAIAEAQSELDEAESDLESLLEELEGLKEQIAEARRAVNQAKRRLAGLEK